MFRDLREAAQRETAQPDRLKDEAISAITKNVRGHLNAGRFEEASGILADALERYPGDVILEGVSGAVDAARRRHLSQIAAARSPDLPAASSRRTVPLYPVIGMGLVVLAAAGVWEFTRTRGPSAGYPSSGYTERGNAPGALSQQKPSDSADISRLQNALTSAIREHSWDEAHLWISRLAELQPGDPRIREWLDQIDQGRTADRKLADLRIGTQSAIRIKNWNEADSKIALLLAQIPGDPEALQWRDVVAEGRKEDRVAGETVTRTRQVNALRAEIPLLIQAKRWDDAQKRISDLQLAVPNDTEADAWQKALTILRISELKQEALADAPVTRTTPAQSGQISDRAPAQVSSETTPPAPVQEKEKVIAALRAPAPVPVESAVKLPPSLPLPVAAAPRSAIITPPAADAQLLARLKSIAGGWSYFNPKAARPRITNGFQFAAQSASVDISPDGGGMLEYAVKPGIWHVAETSVSFHFRLTSWDGAKFVGKSEDGERDYTLTLEPASSSLNLAWKALDKPSNLHMPAGQAVLTRTPAKK